MMGEKGSTRGTSECLQYDAIEIAGSSFPWKIDPTAVVPLLTMLEFSAREYVELSYQFGVILGSIGKKQPNMSMRGTLSFASFGKTSSRLEFAAHCSKPPSIPLPAPNQLRESGAARRSGPAG